MIERMQIKYGSPLQCEESLKTFEESYAFQRFFAVKG